jgi:hypothetical protein
MTNGKTFDQNTSMPLQITLATETRLPEELYLLVEQTLIIEVSLIDSRNSKTISFQRRAAEYTAKSILISNNESSSYLVLLKVCSFSCPQT